MYTNNSVMFVRSVYHHNNVEGNYFINVWMQVDINFLNTPTEAQNSHSKEASKKKRKMNQIVSLNRGQSHWKWHKMVEVNGAHNHVRCERNWLKNLQKMSSLKAVAM